MNRQQLELNGALLAIADGVKQMQEIIQCGRDLHGESENALRLLTEASINIKYVHRLLLIVGSPAQKE